MNNQDNIHYSFLAGPEVIHNQYSYLRFPPTDHTVFAVQKKPRIIEALWIKQNFGTGYFPDVSKFGTPQPAPSLTKSLKLIVIGLSAAGSILAAGAAAG